MTKEIAGIGAAKATETELGEQELDVVAAGVQSGTPQRSPGTQAVQTWTLKSASPMK